MTLLAQRFGRLATLPYVPLVDAPTPVVRLAHVSRELGIDVWCKRDDLSSPRYGGNKTRKLEWLLGDARARHAETLITTGAAGSHHVLATSLFGAQAGFRVHGVMVPQASTEHVLENLRCDLAAGATLHASPRITTAIATAAALHTKLRLSRARPYLIPTGGSSVVGTLGYVEAGLELAAQLAEGALPEPLAVHVALGTGGTAAGLAIGLACAGVTSEVVAVRVTGKLLANRTLLGRLVARTLAHLRKLDDRVPDVQRGVMERLRIDDAEYGEGYGKATPAGRAATELAARDGLVLDPTYTSKAFASLVREARAGGRGPRLLVHTLSAADLSGLLAQVTTLPTEVAALALDKPGAQ